MHFVSRLPNVLEAAHKTTIVPIILFICWLCRVDLCLSTNLPIYFGT